MVERFSAASLPGESLVVPADVRDADAVERVVERVVERFDRIDTLVNNAGVSILGMQDSRKRLVDVDESEWDTVLDVNLKGTFLFTRAALPHMFEQGRGSVINVSSGLGRRAIAGAGAYVSSKWGLEGLTRVTALIRSCVVFYLCSPIRSGRSPVNRYARPYQGRGARRDRQRARSGGRVDTDIWAHLPDEERAEILPPDVMDDAAVLLAAQGPDGVTGESMTAEGWEERLG